MTLIFYFSYMDAQSFVTKKKSIVQTNTAIRATPNIHATLARVITGEAQSKSHGTTTTVQPGGALGSMESTTPISWLEILLFHSRPLCGFGWTGFIRILLLAKGLELQSGLSMGENVTVGTPTRWMLVSGITPITVINLVSKLALTLRVRLRSY